MRNLEKYEGIIPAFYACYDDNGNISSTRVKELTQFFIDKGVKGVYVCGSSGECIYQDVEERKITLESVMAVAKGKLTVIAHVACNNTRDSKILAAHAETLGVDAIAAIPPIYFKLPEYSIADYWNDISESAPNTDFVIYNIPQLAGVALTKDLFIKMLENKNIIGVKNSSSPTMDIQIFSAIMGENGIVFNGPDEQFISGIAIGAKGGIGGTYGVMPHLFIKLHNYIKSGDMTNALNMQNDINEIITFMCSGKGSMYAIIKEVLRKKYNVNIGGVRKPLTDIISGDVDIVNKVCDKIANAEGKYIN